MGVKPRILITNAKVITADDVQPQAEAVGIQGDRIVFVGSCEEAKLWQKADDTTIDAQQCSLLPGIIDAHFHLELGAETLDQINLENVFTLNELTNSLRDYAHHNPNKHTIQGYGLQYTLPTTIHLTRHHIDAIIADRPVIFFAYDSHTAWANTIALKNAGLLYGKELPSGNEIVMLDDGTASGELREPEAYNPILAQIPPLTEASKIDLIQQSCAMANSFGITSVHNMSGNLELLYLLHNMVESGKLTLRVQLPLSITPKTTFKEILAFIDAGKSYQNNQLHAQAVKFFMDGVIESYTGVLIDGYPERPNYHAEAQYSFNQFVELAHFCHQHQLQICTHAVGDGGVRLALDGYETIQKEKPLQHLHHRIEHIETVHPADVDRFYTLGVIASMQPLHCPMQANGSDVWTQRVGNERWKYSFAWKTLRDSGATLVFGSDWHVVSMNPFLGFNSALNRKPWQQDDPEQKQTLWQTISSYTAEAAFAENQHHQKGKIRAGMLADLTLLKQDVTKIPHEDFATVRPHLTMLNGKIVYEG